MKFYAEKGSYIENCNKKVMFQTRFSKIQWLSRSTGKKIIPKKRPERIFIKNNKINKSESEKENENVKKVNEKVKKSLKPYKK